MIILAYLLSTHPIHSRHVDHQVVATREVIIAVAQAHSAHPLVALDQARNLPQEHNKANLSLICR